MLDAIIVIAQYARDQALADNGTLHDAACAAIGVTFVPVLFESLGGSALSLPRPFLPSVATWANVLVLHQPTPKDTYFKDALLHCGGGTQLYG